RSHKGISGLPVTNVTNPPVSTVEVAEGDVPESHSTSNSVTTFVWPSRRTIVVVLVLLVIVGFAFRVNHLGAVGFAEDEVNKVEAVQAYERGDITANGEHPMLMKALMFVSLRAGYALEAAGRTFTNEALLR